MALHAVQDIGDAFTVTRKFLTPVDIRRWLKLAFVVLFIGGGSSLPGSQFNTSGGSNGMPAEEIPASLPAEISTLVIAAAAVAVVLAVAFALIGAIMEFVFVESLRTGTASIRQYWSERWRQGLRLFGFRIAIGLPMLAVVIGWIALFFVPVLTGLTGPIVPFGVFLLGLPILFVVGLLYAVVSSFTTVFVVPMMIKNDCGVLAGWRPLWGSIKAEPKQYLAYAVIGFLLTVGTGLLASVAAGIGAIVLLVPLGLLAVIVHVTVSLSSTVGIAVLVTLALVFVLAMIVLWAVLRVPIVAYLRYYALLVLGDIDAAFDLIPERRVDVDQ